MTRSLWESWAKIGPRLAKANPLLACFDYDGTLTPIALTPEEAIATAEVHLALRDLCSLPGVHGAVVSGRPMEHLLGLVPAEALWLIGSHGLSVRSPKGESSWLIDEEAAKKSLDPLRAVSRRIAAAAPGLRLEDKGSGLAMHTRIASREAAKAAGEAFCKEAENLQGFALLHGKEVHEVRPVGIDKGRAVLALRSRLAPVSLVLFVGDDTTDEDAFQALGDVPSVTVKVGEEGEETFADYRVDDTDDVLELLRRIKAER